MPTVQPAAAGTQEKLEVGRTRGGLVRVIKASFGWNPGH
jgi:hypothetical protein